MENRKNFGLKILQRRAWIYQSNWLMLRVMLLSKQITIMIATTFNGLLIQAETLADVHDMKPRRRHTIEPKPRVVDCVTSSDEDKALEDIGRWMWSHMPKKGLWVLSSNCLLLWSCVKDQSLSSFPILSRISNSFGVTKITKRFCWYSLIISLLGLIANSSRTSTIVELTMTDWWHVLDKPLNPNAWRSETTCYWGNSFNRSYFS